MTEMSRHRGQEQEQKHWVTSIISYLLQPENLERIIYIARDIFRWCANIARRVPEELQSRNVALRSDYRQQVGKLRKLQRRCNRFIETVSRHPNYDEEAILAELSDEDSRARFTMENRVRFPHTIEFVNNLKIWLGRVKGEANAVNQHIQVSIRETREKLLEAREVECKGRNSKNMATGIGGIFAVGASIVIGAVAAVAMTGGASLVLLPLVSLVPVTGGVSAYSFKKSAAFKEEENDSYQLSLRLDNLNRIAHKLDKLNDAIEDKRDDSVFDDQLKAVHSQHPPLLVNLKGSFLRIFEQLEKNRDFDGERADLRGIMRPIVNAPRV